MNVLDLNKRFYKKFKGKKGIIGLSQKGRPIYFYGVEIGDYPRIIVQASIHAREFITAYLTYPNFYRIKKWNNSNWYAIAIAELADYLH